MTSPKTIKDLPIYSDPNSKNFVWVTIDKKHEPTTLEEGISTVRQAGCQFLSQFKHQKEETMKFYESTSNRVTQQLDYIRAETNLIPKVVFITLSGFSGLLVGFRRSSFRKFIYSSALATGATALCFPKEAKAFSTQAYDSTKQQAYQFYRDYIYPEEKSSTGKKNMAGTSIEDQVKKQVDSKDKVLQLKSDQIEASKSSKKLVGDVGQASEADKDMYTTRSK